MSKCGSCGALAETDARECRHCGMPILLAAPNMPDTPNMPTLPDMPDTAASSSTETPTAKTADARSPSVYAPFSPIVGAASEQQQSTESNEPHQAPASLDSTPIATAGFADWHADAAQHDEPAPISAGDGAHAVYMGYMQRDSTDGLAASGPIMRLSDGAAADLGEIGSPHDLRAVSAYGIRYRDASVTSDMIQDNTTTSEPLEAQAKGNIAMMTATSVARVIVRSIGEATPEQEREFALDGRTVTVGRSPACDISLEGDQLASRRHALLRAEGDRYTLVDLGSSNGSFVNDVEIQEPTVLHDGDHITIGEHDLLFLTGPASPSASVAGVRLDGEQFNPQAPQGETSPHPAIASIPAWQNDGFQQPAAQQSQQDQLDPFAASAAFAPPAPQVDDALIAPPAPPAPPVVVASPAPMSAPPGVITPITPSVPAPTASADALEKIRAQLTDASMALAQQSEAEARLADQRRATVTEISSLLNDLLSQEQDAGMPSSADIEALAQVARETAANPRHLDALNALAARATDLAQALEAQRQWLAKRADLLNTLNALRAKLDQLG